MLKTPVADKRTDETPVPKTWFARKKNALSNLYPCDVIIYGTTYASSEHAYQTRKAEYHNDGYSIELFQNDSDPWAAKHIGESVTTTDEWREKDCYPIMMEIVKAKAQSCVAFRKALIETGTNTLHEATLHPFWAGCGGEDKLGQIHHVRDLIREGKLPLRKEKQKQQPNFKTEQKKPPNTNRQPGQQHPRMQQKQSSSTKTTATKSKWPKWAPTEH